jgi:hypothetical protein
VELEVYAILYQVGNTRRMKSVANPWFPIIPSILLKSQSTLALKKRHRYVGVIHDPGKSSIDLVLNVWGAIYDIVQSAVDTVTLSPEPKGTKEF